MMDFDVKSPSSSLILIAISSVFLYRRASHFNIMTKMQSRINVANNNNNNKNNLNKNQYRNTSCYYNNNNNNIKRILLMMTIYIFIIFLSTKIPLTSCEKLRSQQQQHHYHTHHDHGPKDDNHQHNIPHVCNHVYPTVDEVVLGAMPETEPIHVIRKRSIDQPLRIVLFYDESVYKLEKEQLDLINNTVLPRAIDYWQKALKVRRTENRILLNRRCPNQQVYYKADDPHPYCKLQCETKTMCGEMQVPEEHLDACRVCDENGHNCKTVAGSLPGEGIKNADFVFYVSALQTYRCKHGFTVAYAAHCQQEATLDRPIAGHANLCPKSINTKLQELDTLISTVKHEILHALGFSVSLYAFFRDDNGQPLTPRDAKGKPPLNEQLQARQWSDRIIKTITRKDWRVRDGNITREMQMVVTPRVREEVRKHFNCNDLEGAELEDQGGEGTALTHWEKRIFENEAMTGTHTQNPVYSKITLALMEDTGWYRANYSVAQELNWGNNLGCDFVKKSCMDWMMTSSESSSSTSLSATKHDPLPFCNKIKSDPLETQCTEDHSSVALCNLIKYPNPVPSDYRNFETLPNVDEASLPYYGGSVILADYCPYVQEFIWRANNVVIRGSHCFYEENNPEPDKNFALEEYGEGAKCFYHTKEMWEERSCTQKRHWQHFGSGCYRYMCQDGLLHILLTNKTFTCYYTGQEIKIQLMANKWLHRGGIKCPNCMEFCDDCSNNVVDSSGLKLMQQYPQDSLTCAASSLSTPFLVLLPIIIRTFDFFPLH